MLRGVDLTVERGGTLVLLGTDGGGTTLIRVLATLLPADGGIASVTDFDVAAC